MQVRTSQRLSQANGFIRSVHGPRALSQGLSLGSAVSTSSERKQSIGGPYLGQDFLVNERDACGVGFVADMSGR